MTLMGISELLRHCIDDGCAARASPAHQVTSEI
jgi:hypothetical protein